MQGLGECPGVGGRRERIRLSQCSPKDLRHSFGAHPSLFCCLALTITPLRLICLANTLSSSSGTPPRKLMFCLAAPR